MHPPTILRRSARSLAVSALLLPLLVAGEHAALAAAPFPVVRRSGDDRFSTAAAISAATFDPAVDLAYVATGSNYPDALAAGPVAGVTGRPILLTSRDTLPASTTSELRRLRPAAIAVLGGPAAISDTVLAALDGYTDGEVTRIAGPDRFATAAAVSASGFPARTTTAFVATGDNFPDALSGGAAAAARAAPIVLVGRDHLPVATAAELTRLDPDEIIVIGGEAAVSAAVFDALSAYAPAVRRVAGLDRYATSVAVSRDTFYPPNSSTFLATGDNFPDALAGAPAAAAEGAAVLLTSRDCAPGVTRDEVFRLNPERVVVLGGLAAVSDAAASLTACSAPAPPSFEVDSALTPVVATLPAITEDGPPRPLARLVDQKGHVADFVANELVVMTDDQAALDAFVARWNGVVLRSTVFADAGIDAPDMHVVQVDPSAADIGSLTAHLHELDPLARGAHRVSSEEALSLIAAAAAEADGGLTIGINWVPADAAVADGSARESYQGERLPGRTKETSYTYQDDPFLWPYVADGGAQDIGLSEAWRLIDLAGLSSNKVLVAVLDGGFGRGNQDFPSDWLAISLVPGQPAKDSENPFQPDKRWHGTNVAVVATGQVDNGFGTAGSAGQVARLVTVQTTGDMFMGILATTVASQSGARVLNMSYGIPVPATLSWSVIPFSAATTALRASGHLLFAAAGNANLDVDAEDCFGVCWEEAWVAPCENGGVICVGGLDTMSINKATDAPDRGSNYGYESCGRSPCGVDIFGPYEVFVGWDPDNQQDKARFGAGTSFSSPFVAGVAALMWAANPALSASQVESLLLSTAHPNIDHLVGRHVDAQAAVGAAYGRDVPPVVQVQQPVNGFNGSYGSANFVSLRAKVWDYEDRAACCAIRWSTDVDGSIGAELDGAYAFDSPGKRVVTATVTDSSGATSSRSVTIRMFNDTPQVTITKPPNNATRYANVAFRLAGEASDPNEGDLPCGGLRWDSDQPQDQQGNGGDFPVFGCKPLVTVYTTGQRRITLTAYDEIGASNSASRIVNFENPPPNPEPWIITPEEGAVMHPGNTYPLQADSYHDADPVTYAWYVRRNTPTSVTEWEQIWNGQEGEFRPADWDSLNGRCGDDVPAQIRVDATDDDGTGEAIVDIVVRWPVC